MNTQIELHNRIVEIERSKQRTAQLEQELLEATALIHQHSCASIKFGGLSDDPFVELHGTFTPAALREISEIFSGVPYNLRHYFNTKGV